MGFPAKRRESLSPLPDTPTCPLRERSKSKARKNHPQPRRLGTSESLAKRGVSPRLSVEVVEILKLGTEPTVHASAKNGNGIVRVQRREMRSDLAKINEARIIVQLFVQKTRSILNELYVVSIQFGECLFVFPPHHYLCFRTKSP